MLRCIGANITLADTKHEARPLNAEQWFKPAPTWRRFSLVS